ncbi:MAG: superoxide dismutase [Candidatus Harrisonbacteria bacterium RIFCSPLOWO2_02_FULL_41_11]|uniref:superoxide dismutase n=1 Tax=Candidatus Harrisonbacteria bacterium RIFCSPHIGHO2_02_FULL_42_16 TaxID=1798404 RepID=A0A1G1ZFR2_9BACT|nr:MAG: superoxide dismutase [Candidatus Harrisonbacteria bacterium RIFCSPHIGHO2_02_FULL_42_16]OGY66182.1 MAG: superoxide dismutase [Candidatus Harrisonbacteria bacterium RIFCSPLOWO2_02_FULL_41_11]
MAYEPKNYNHLLGTDGFSDNLLKTHFGLYEGYVKNTNKLVEQLKKYTDEENIASPEYAELKRRFGWEFNGMRLHEYYFGNMAKGGGEPDKAAPLYKKLEEVFGSYQNWEKDFKATGAMRGIGWAILYQDEESKKLFNIWVNEHDFGHLAGGSPLLVMDVFEHAFVLDYGMKRGEYIDAFMRAVDWEEVNKRAH